MSQGTIRSITHLCSAADFSSTHLVSTHNGVGYGYIKSPDGDVFFDDLGLKNSRFDRLKEDMVVEYVLENAAYRRASSVTVIDERKNLVRQSMTIPSASTQDGVGEMRIDPRDEPMDVVDESSLEPFPASDSPAHWVGTTSES